MKASKTACKPLGLTVGALSGMPAGTAFEQVWKRLGHDEDTPNATDEHRTRPAVLSATALQGAIFAGVKAAVGRGGGTATRRLTGTWPG